MQVFVTGANGFIGGAVAAALIAAGHKVRGLVRNKAKASAVAAHAVQAVVGSLDDAALCCDAVFFGHDRHSLFVLVRKYFAEPSNATGNTQDKTEDADRNARKKAREHQRESESQNNGPGR